MEVSDRPVQIRDHQAFLMEYRTLLPIEFDKTKLAETKEGTETWSFISDHGSVVGSASMRFDQDGHFLGFKVNALDRVSAE